MPTKPIPTPTEMQRRIDETDKAKHDMIVNDILDKIEGEWQGNGSRVNVPVRGNPAQRTIDRIINEFAQSGWRLEYQDNQMHGTQFSVCSL